VILRFTVTDPDLERELDVEAVLEPTDTVADLLAVLPFPVQARICFCGDEPLDPGTTIAQSPLIVGAHLTLGQPGSPTRPRLAGTIGLLRVTAGPDAGRSLPLSTGSYTVGRTREADLELSDPLISRQQCVLSVAEQEIVVTDQNSANGTLIAGTAISDRQVWPAGVDLHVGDDVIQFLLLSPQDRRETRSRDGRIEFDRAFAGAPSIPTVTIRLPSPPSVSSGVKSLLTAAAAPIVLGIALALVLHQWYLLVFAVFSPLTALITYLLERRHRRAATRDWQVAKTGTVAEINRALRTEAAIRHQRAPEPAVLALIAAGTVRGLWPRTIDSPDALVLRIGTTDQTPAFQLQGLPWPELEPPVLQAVPATLDLRAVGVLGVVGPPAHTSELTNWLLIQLATLRSPSDLRLVILTPDHTRTLTWARWLPHLDTAGNADAPAWVGNTAPTRAERITELQDLIAARQESLAEHGAARFDCEVVVVLQAALVLRTLPGMRQLLQEGPEVGVYTICVDERDMIECRGLAQFTAAGLSLRRHPSDQPDQARAETLTGDVAQSLARSLATMRDRLVATSSGSSLPASSRLLDILSLDPPQAAAIAAGWAQQPRSTVAVLGEDRDGLFSVDLNRDGPHALVAGTTGSGKSELLQTLIASLAVGNRPDEMTFVLVDYKGGAAFKDCRYLPHTVGMVTDLDAHLTVRALESLGAELHRRERRLAAAGAKDIEDYTLTRTQSGNPGIGPMPRLVLVIDEFATLVAELPDFISGLVDIARRGRSLGVHLILATQRPAGVLSPEIKSNTTLRIALRVTDPQDSQDVIESSAAATIAKSLPGRAYARLGHSLLTAFHAARVGGRPAGTQTQVPIRARTLPWADLGLTPTGETIPDEDISSLTDLTRLVQAITAAARGIDSPPSPWLEPLPDRLCLDDVISVPTSSHLSAPPGRPDSSPAPPPGQLPPLTIGLLDLPAAQHQAPASYDFARTGHLAIIGAPRSGRSSTLRTIAAAVARTHSPTDVHLYGLDCGSNALLPIMSLPHTGAVITRDQPDRLSRLTARLLTQISQRQQHLAHHGFADLSEQRAAAPEAHRLPYLLILLDRWEIFVSTFESFDSGRLVDQWLQILQEGPASGVCLALSIDRTGLTGRLSSLIDDKLVLRLSDPSDFTTIGLPTKQVPKRMPPGRGFRTATLAETQIALLTRQPSGTAEVAALQELGRQASARFQNLPPGRHPFRVDQLPARISLTEALALPSPSGSPSASVLPIAVGGDTLTLHGFDAPHDGPGLLIAGPRRSGRSTALQVLTESALTRGWSVAVLTTRISPLRDLQPHPRLLGSWTPDTAEADRTHLTTTLTDLRSDSAPSLLVIDDLDLLGPDGWLPDLITEHTTALRDSGGLVAAAGALDELTTMYRGPVTTLKRSRSGLLLAPAAPNDGDLFTLRLPRTAYTHTGPGRGILIRSGEWESVQVPHL